MRWLERRIILDVVDAQWKDHLLSLDHLKEGIGLRGYGQKDPLVEFKKEAFILFEDMMARIDNETVRYLFQRAGADGRAAAATATAEVHRSTPVPQRKRLAPAGGRGQRCCACLPTKLNRTTCRHSRAKWNASSSARKERCSIKPGPRRLKRRSRFAPERKSAATILVRAVPGKNTRSATA